MDLKEERQKVIDTILSMNQFPSGMEMFSAADEEQWEIIKETIDTSDYYILIVGMKYGAIEPESGISYTEKEFNYAIEHGIPVLAFIIADDIPIPAGMMESDPVKAAGLAAFKIKVKTGRVVKFWHNADELATQVSQSIYKVMSRANRPGWVRTTEFDIEKSYSEIIRLTERIHQLEAMNADLSVQNQRKPHLWIETCPEVFEGEVLDENITIQNGNVYLTVAAPDMSDAEEGIDYKDIFGTTVHAEYNEVRLFRHICKNTFPLKFVVHNDGDFRATGVRVKITFPDGLAVISGSELMEYITPETIHFSKDAHDHWDERFFSPSNASDSHAVNKFVDVDELITIDDIANLLDPGEANEVYSIFPGEVFFDMEEIRHLDKEYIRNVYLLPCRAGEFEVKCEILCNEEPERIEQIIKIIAE